MTVCSPVCRRAVQRKITCPGEPIWISDDVLHRSYQRFLSVSKTAKRYGSFVPGPLESRRRLGKREMAHASASAYTPMSVGGIGALWRWFRQSDNMQYEWQAPTIRPPAEEPPDLVQDWLSGWAIPPTPAKGISEPAAVEVEQSAADSPEVAESSERAESQPTDRMAETLEFRLRFFRKSMWAAASRKDAIKLCENFTRDLTESLAVEGTHTEVVHWTLSLAVMNDISRAISDSKTSGLCLVALYEKIWEGMSACESLDTNGFSKKITHRLLNRLTVLMDLPQARSLSSTILQSLSPSQQLGLRGPITNVVFAWMKTWVKPEAPFSTDEFAEDLVYTKIRSKIERVHHDIWHLSSATSLGNLGTDRVNLKSLAAVLKSAKLEIIEAIRAIDRLEDKFRPPRKSAEDLAQALSNITNDTRRSHKRQSMVTPSGVLRSVILSCSKQISTNHEISPQRVRISALFMDVVTLLPKVHDDLFHEVCRDMVACRYSALPVKKAKTLSKSSTLWLLQRWTTRKEIPDPVLVSNGYAVMANAKGGGSHVTLLFAIHYYGGDITHAYNLLLTFFMSTGTGGPKMMHSIVSRLQDQKIRLHPQPFSRSLDLISQGEPKLARGCLAVYKEWLSITPQPQHLHRPTGLRLEYCPNFVLTLIENTTIPPHLIWELLDIPLYASLDASVHVQHPRKRELSPEIISLMEQMALKFSAADTRPERLALRNVEQCLLHLVAHEVHPIPEGIAQAISHAGLTRKLLENDGIIGLARLRWCLHKIERIEGGEVAKSVDEQVYWYKQFRLEKRWEKRRITRALPIRILDRW
ncbi:hypothetical protein HYFRA_00002647 [Hymenoscyphus fraxineus]|uniref:Uncharacterized protein n=1 Tax=Hymenoscyphus fraxineus TaxID=746836 RepID=A0A9N9L8M3_9HELO|nr:hypothetical protein HYFRA_00002647 [Hymenoscyphus fraxineus]